MQFHILSFEGPDAYARAGGLASRVDGLSRTLAGLGFETHLWFVGDPDLPGHETRGRLLLHRWCQWISREHRGGVYQGEEAKVDDYARSLPPYAIEHHLLDACASGEGAVVLAEEWHTVGAVLEFDRRLRELGVRNRVSLLWNANNLFGFEHIPWRRLCAAAVLTTVSRMMRLRMESLGVKPLVISNGLPAEAYRPCERKLLWGLRRRLRGRLPLVKIARWDPDKGWLATLRSLDHLRRAGAGPPPLLLARGGVESHEREVRALADGLGLRWVDRDLVNGGPHALLEVLESLPRADVLSLRAPLQAEATRALFRAAGCVLADSRFEPFGLVALEAMAVGGVACTRLTGEDYVIPGRNALVLQSEDPRELAALLRRLTDHPDEERSLRRAARVTARQFAWTEIVRRVLLPRLDLMREPVAPEG